MAELIKADDKLNEGRIKINKSIKDSEDAKIISQQSDEKAELALSKSEETQQQLDTIVIEGDSSVEAAQARIDKDNHEYSTLKQRLDAEQVKVDEVANIDIGAVNLIALDNLEHGTLSLTTGDPANNTTTRLRSIEHIEITAKEMIATSQTQVYINVFEYDNNKIFIKHHNFILIDSGGRNFNLDENTKYIKVLIRNNENNDINPEDLLEAKTQLERGNRATDWAMSPNDKANRSDVIDIKQRISGVSIKDLEYPIYIAHRGGKNVYPENSMEAFKYCVDAGFPIEFDVRLNADGTPVISHDATMNRFSNRTGSISNYSTAAFVNAKITELGTGFEGSTTTLEDMFRVFGNKAIYVIEPKDRDSPPVIIDLIKKYSLHDNIIYQSFNRNDLNPALNEGLFVGFLSDTAITNPEQLKDDGVSYAAMRKTVATSAIQNCKDAGLDVYIYTVNTRFESDDLISKGADGIISDDPYWVSKTSKVLPRDNFDQQTWYHGQFSPPASGNFKGVRGSFIPPGIFGWEDNYTEAGLDYCMQGWVGELSQNFEFEIHIFPKNLAGATRWPGIAFCTPLDFYDNETSNSSGYNVIFREKGEMALYKNVNGTTTLLDSASGPPMEIGTRLIVNIKVQGNSVVVKRTDSQAPNLEVSSNDNQFRRGFLHLGRNRTGVTFGNGKYTNL